MGGRVLWHNYLFEEACNLFWLSIEQALKILVFQDNIVEIGSTCKDIDAVYKVLEKKGKRISHLRKTIVLEVENIYDGLDLTPYYGVMDKLEEYYFRRYAIHKSSSIILNLIDEVDELYFSIREHIIPELGLGLIDEIYYQKKHGWNHPLGAFSFAYYQNKSFKGRKHTPINLAGPDGIIYIEDGTAPIKVFHLGKTM